MDPHDPAPAAADPLLAALVWMLVALFLLAANWISTWDYRTLGNLSLVAIGSDFLFVVLNYFFCALVSPDFEGGETYDLKQFHDREASTYILVLVAIILLAIVENFAAGAGLGLHNVGAENVLVIGQLPLAVLPLLVKRPWAQVGAPAALLVSLIAYTALFYPMLAK